MLAKAKECWEQEHEEREAEKARYLAERIPTLQTRGLSLSALQVGVWGRVGVGLQVGDGGGPAGRGPDLAQSSILPYLVPSSPEGWGHWIPSYRWGGSCRGEGACLGWG